MFLNDPFGAHPIWPLAVDPFRVSNWQKKVKTRIDYLNQLIHNPNQLTFPFGCQWAFVGLSYQGKDIVFRFIIEYSSLRDFGP